MDNRNIFKRRLSIAIGSLTVSLTALSVFFFYLNTRDLLLEQMGNHLKDVGKLALTGLSDKHFKAIEVLKQSITERMRVEAPVLPPIVPGAYKTALQDASSQELASSEEFLLLTNFLQTIKESTIVSTSPGHDRQYNIAYATLLTGINPSPETQIVQFIADPDYLNPKNPNPIGNLFNNNSSAIKNALAGTASADQGFHIEQGEVLLTAALPIKNTLGEVVAVLALDYDANSEANKVERLKSISYMVIFVSAILSLLLANTIANYLNKPVNKLRLGAERVAARDFATRVSIQTKDEFGLLANTFNEMVSQIERYASELESMNTSYARFVPSEFLSQLGKDNIVSVNLGDQIQRQMTILFSDIRGFATISENMSPRDNFDFVNDYLRVVSPIIRKHGGFIDKFIGDGIMALFPESAENALRAAIAMQQALPDFNRSNLELGKPQIKVGIGLHSGHIMLGTVGEEQRMEATVISDSVNLTSRLEGLTKDFGASIIISEKALMHIGTKEGFHFRALGKLRLRGKNTDILAFEALDGEEADSARRKIISTQDFEKGVRAFEVNDLFKAKRYFKRVLRINRSDLACLHYLQRIRLMGVKQIKPTALPRKDVA